MIDKDTKDYLELISKIMAIDMNAADYLLTRAIYLTDFSFNGELSCCFPWIETEQGFAYWDKLNNLT